MDERSVVMWPVMLEWAGESRPFEIPTGGVFDIEEACGKVGIGAIYKRITAHDYFARELYHIIRQGLIGGGMKAAEADALLLERFHMTPMMRNHEVALEILIALMAGLPQGTPATDRAPGEEAKPWEPGAWFAALIRVGVTPEQLRAMRYADFIAMAEAMAKAVGDDADLPEFPDEDEFEEMLKQHDPDQYKRMKAQELAAK